MSPYLYYCLKARTSDIGQRATGTTFKEISGSEMAETIIPLPPIDEQQRIFDKVTQLLEALSTIESDIATLEQQIEDTDNEMLKAANDFVKLGELSAKKEDLQKELEHKMDRWIYLEELADKISGNA